MLFRGSLVFAWALTIACLNWICWKLTGWPVAYCVGKNAVTPILAFVPFINLALAAFMVVRFVGGGFWAGIQVAGVLVGLAVLPDTLRATLYLGGTC
jgi:hypothetical protein